MSIFTSLILINISTIFTDTQTERDNHSARLFPSQILNISSQVFIQNHTVDRLLMIKTVPPTHTLSYQTHSIAESKQTRVLPRSLSISRRGEHERKWKHGVFEQRPSLRVTCVSVLVLFPLLSSIHSCLISASVGGEKMITLRISQTTASENKRLGTNLHNLKKSPLRLVNTG